MEGLALMRDFSRFNKYEAKDIKPYTGPPCSNCQQLLRWAGVVDPADYHFDPKAERPVVAAPLTEPTTDAATDAATD